MEKSTKIRLWFGAIAFAVVILPFAIGVMLFPEEKISNFYRRHGSPASIYDRHTRPYQFTFPPTSSRMASKLQLSDPIEPGATSPHLAKLRVMVREAERMEAILLGLNRDLISRGYNESALLAVAAYGQAVSMREEYTRLISTMEKTSSWPPSAASQWLRLSSAHRESLARFKAIIDAAARLD